MCTKRKNFTIVLLLLVVLLCASVATVFSTQTVAWAAESSGLAFVQTSETTCSVRLLDKTVTTVRIPQKAEIDGNVYTVTSVAANGFAKATNLEKVQLPKTLKSIGNSAFSNCQNMKTIMLSGVESIAANAFNSCTSLQYIILPKSVTNIGSTILRGAPQVKVYARALEAQSGWVANWNMVASNTYAEVEYGSDFNPEIEYKKVDGIQTYGLTALKGYPSMGLNGDHYVVDGFQNIDNVNHDVYIPATYKSEDDEQAYPVMKIADGAFNGNKVNMLIVEYSEDPIYIETSVFTSLTAKKVIINRPIVLYDELMDGVSDNVFGAADVETVILPNNISEIGSCMFSECAAKDILFIEPSYNVIEENITNEYEGTGIVVLPLSVTAIYDNAFDSANNLTEIRFTNNITIVGIGVLAGWKPAENVKKQIIIPYNKKSDLPDGWDSLWDAGCDTTLIVYKDEYTISYELNGGQNVGNPNSYKSVDDILLKDATRLGYIFAGWFDNEEFEGDKIERIKGMSGDKTFYAQWTPIEYWVKYVGNSPISVQVDSGTGTTKHTYDTERTLAKNGFSLDGWLFSGWNTRADGSGTHYDDGEIVKNLSAENGATVELYAQWTPIPYKISFNTNGGNAVSDITVYRGLPIGELPVATRTDCEFLGWSTKEYGDCDIVETSVLENAANIKVYAQWLYSITFRNGAFTQIVKGKHNDNITLLSPFNGGYNGVWTIGGNEFAFGSNYKIDNAPVTMTAYWTEKTFEQSRNSAGEYEVWTRNQFEWVREHAMEGLTFNLKGDIYYSGQLLWQPIEKFNGKIIGNGHNVEYYNMNIKGDFAFIIENHGVIENLKVRQGFNLASDADKSKYYVIGGLVAKNYGTVKDITISKVMTNVYTTAEGFVYADMAFRDCSYNVGGVVGHNYGTVENCTNNASLAGTAHFGGIVSLNAEGARIINCINYGTILYTKANALDACIGGIAGTVRTNGTVTGCKNYGTITWVRRLSEYRYVSPRIGQCVGQLSKSASFSNNYSVGKVEIDSSILPYVNSTEKQYVKNEAYGYMF